MKLLRAVAHAAGPAGGHHALGGYHAHGGVVGLLVHLFIWRMIWRLLIGLWRIHTFGPIIVGLIVVALIGLAVLRATGRWPGRRRGGGFRQGTGQGPRDW